ncbi:MAG: aryl-sulfate sulfotransferase [Bacteroidota bacterium]|nr:aryl-sulfate sulfotransferase [Bacteroidota bacterium]
MLKYLFRSIVLFFCITFYISCSNANKNIISEIKTGLHNNNQLKIQLDVKTISPADVYAEYWTDSAGAAETMLSATSKNATTHALVLCNIFPKTDYSYHIITSKNGVKEVSETYKFTSPVLPIYLQDQFKSNSTYPNQLPPEFKNGFMLFSKRETPGTAYIIDYNGNLRWYHMIDGTGFKVCHFTKDKTIISILGKNDEPTSYGSEILEINLSGDTLLHLKKGQGDFTQTIHHEIIKNNKKEILTLFVDEKIMDLTAIGGDKRDTVKGDGILIMDKQAKKIWQWSVFDVLNPLDDPHLNKNKKDWMHANSLNFDKDSNYIISFYNIGQIWKIDAHNGKVLWKLGKGGDMQMPAGTGFSESHAVHINASGDLMFFDNGVEKRQSEIWALQIDEQNKTAKIKIDYKLPVDIYNERMGSAYMINDTSILCCCSKKHITVLTNRNGVLLWTLQTQIPPYRVEFLKGEQVTPFLQP